jgi:dethiobiotin synthetase
MAKRGFFITGTDTGVGKTIVTAGLLSLFKKHRLDAGVMKPIETGVVPGQKSLSDAEFLMRAGEIDDPLAEVSPYRLRTPASPFYASRIEKRPIDIKIILKDFHRLAGKHEYMLVEGVGGILTPITAKIMVADLIRELRLPVIIVSRFTIGALNHTLMTLKTAQEKGLAVRGVIFNQTKPKITAIEKAQSSLLRELTSAPVLGECAFIKNISPASSKLLAAIEKNLDFDALR